ncbi:TetR/AcrR family transcriptional regulator [Bauldia sp.]|uniref:TetR/AcrR family transcriptional regulator n=1 Tax=Bauldia sp. TaxID=2575872 RepID=UPI003BAC8700
MQAKGGRRSNAERTEETRAALIAAARALFVAEGYAGTATPDIVKTAGVTRGALYHHFEDKAALFRAVVEAEAVAVADKIDTSTAGDDASIDALIAGATAYFDAMAAPGRAQLMLIEGPAVLGHTTVRDISARTDAATLIEGLRKRADDAGATIPVEAVADLLSAMFDRAALAIATGAEPEPYKRALETVMRGLIP